MDMQTVTTLIGSLGFPIVMCVILLKQNRENSENFMKQLQDTESVHKEEIDTLRECVNNNTLVQQQILEHIRKEK